MSLLQLISGPVLWSYFQFEGTSYHFFGDIHYSKEGSCEDIGYTCSTIDQPDVNSPCYNFNYLLSSIFQQAQIKGESVDYFLEIPYAKKEDQPFSKTSSLDNYLDESIHYFLDDINKTKLSSNVRIHYVDVRRNPSDENVSLNSYIYTFLFDQLNDSIYQMIQTGQQDLFAWMEFTNDLFEKLWKEGFYKKLFWTYFEDDYIELSKELLQELPSHPWMQTIQESMLQQSKSKGGVNRHFIKIQLDELRKENPKVASQIQKFISHEFSQLNVEELYTSWKELFDLFQETFSSRFTVEDLFQLEDLLHDFKKEATLLVVIDSLLVDAYTLARMFRRYGKKEQPTKVITFTGVAHTKNFISFFKNWLHVIPLASKEGLPNAKRCIRDEQFSTYF